MYITNTPGDNYPFINTTLNPDSNLRLIAYESMPLGYDLDSMLNLGIERKPCHDLLGVSSSASKTEINQAYRKLALIHHPERR
ncbi:MAG: J domain-containing protein [Pseudomonadota bacterium]